MKITNFLRSLSLENLTRVVLFGMILALLSQDAISLRLNPEVEAFTKEVFQKPTEKHLEKLKAFEILAENYAAAEDTTREKMSELAKISHDALLLRDVDAAMELSYACMGLNNYLSSDKVLALNIISPFLNSPKASALKEFILSRSVENAQTMLDVADTPESKALAYMAMADAYYARNNQPKAILFATLSLAYNFSDLREAQVRYYLTGDPRSNLSLNGSREEVIENLNEVMRETLDPHAFRRYFSMATVLGLLPSFPLEHSKNEVQDAEPLHLCLAFDDNFAPHGMVTMLSAMLSANPESKYVFHIMEDVDTPIHENYKERICDFINEIDGERFEVSFEPVDKSILHTAIGENKKFRHWPRLVLFKLYIPDIFPDLKRLLWLDADLIIREDLSTLYNSPLGGKWIAGVRDADIDTKEKFHLSLPEGAEYLNGGVLLYNIAEILSEHGCDRFTEYCENNPGFEQELRLPEQDLFALVLSDKLLEIEHQRPIHLPDGSIQKPRWNWRYAIDKSTHWGQVHLHPVGIIHMSGSRLKPWKQKLGPTLWTWLPKRNDGVQNIYWSLRDMGPWAMR